MRNTVSVYAIFALAGLVSCGGSEPPRESSAPAEAPAAEAPPAASASCALLTRGGYPGGSREGAGCGPDARRHRRVHLVGGRRPVFDTRSPDDFGFGLRDVRRLRRQLFGRIRRRTTTDRVLPSNPRCRRLGHVCRRRERDSGVQGRPYAAGGAESPERCAGSCSGAKGRSAATLSRGQLVRRWDGDVPKPHRKPCRAAGKASVISPRFTGLRRSSLSWNKWHIICAYVVGAGKPC